LILAGLTTACTREEPATIPAVEPPDSIAIFYTCDTRGHVNPCDCAAGVAGGMARRASYIAKERPNHALILDAGDVTAGPREWEQLELEYILRGYQRIGYHAVNVGAREASMPIETLASFIERFPFFVSANVTDDSGKPVADPYRIVTMPGGYRVGVLGVVDDKLLPDELGDGIHIAPMTEAIGKTIETMKGACDFTVLLAFADEETMKAVARQFFEIDLIIGGRVRQPIAEPLQVNKSFIASITDKGKSVGRMDLYFPGGQKVVGENTIAMLLETVPDDPEIVALMDELRRKQVENNYPTQKDDEEGLSGFAPAAVAGAGG
jgi:5'-nucleotidase